MAVRGTEDNNNDAWVHEVGRALKRCLTFDLAREWRPTWSPSGEEITFMSAREGNDDLFSRPADGSGEPTRPLATPALEIAPDWSPVGKYLIYHAPDPETIRDRWYFQRKEDNGFESVLYL